MIKLAERAFIKAKSGKKEQAAKKVVSRFTFRSRTMCAKPGEYNDYLEPIKEESTFDMNASWVSREQLVDVDQPEMSINPLIVTPIRRVSGKPTLSDKRVGEKTPSRSRSGNLKAS